MISRIKVRAYAPAQSGFTLLEVMLAVVIVGTVFVACLTLVNQSIHSQKRVENVTTATLLARHKMSELEVRARRGDSTSSEQSGAYDEPYSQYAWEVEYLSTPLEGVQQIRVSVRWGATEHNEEVVIDSFRYN
ncbi:MAG: type II secretion system protein [Desulfuromonadaceae bacterium]|nr:type II secretion system protein [Desulfuromonadaceae bacterium]